MQFNAIATKTFAVGAALTLALVGCGANNSSQASSSASSSSASSSSASASSSVAVQKEAVINWTAAGSADEAAQGAGLDKFGVIGDITLDGKDFNNPKFFHSGGVAQAIYDTDGVQFILRKGANGHTVPITDRDLTTFANKETVSIEGMDVTEYGAAHGASTVLTWNDSGFDFGITYQAANKGDASMDAKEVEEIIKAVKEANAAAQPQQSNASSSQQQNNGSSSQQQGSDQQQQQQQGSGEEQAGVNDSQAQADANSAALAKSNALAATGLSGSVSDAAVSWQGDHWLVAFTYNDTFFEVDCDSNGVVLDTREYQNGVKVEYGQNNEGVVNQEEIDEAGQESRTEEGADEGNISKGGENGDGSNG